MAKQKHIALIFIVSILVFLGVSRPGASSEIGPRFERTVLDNGLVLLLAEEHSLPFVSMRLLVDAGSRRDPRGEEGLARLTARGVIMGTARRQAHEISGELDFMGASLSPSTSRDFVSVSFRVLKKDLGKGLDLFFDAVTGAIFPEDEIRRELEQTLSMIRLDDESPGKLADKAFEKALFLDTPYGHPVEGTVVSVTGLTRDKLKEFYGKYYRPNNAILAVTGDITLGEVKSRLVPSLMKWAAAPIPEAPVEAQYGEGPKTHAVEKSVSQANIIIGNKGLRRADPDYYAATVMNYILGGGGFSSRLMEDIRNRKGLAYSVASGFDAGKLPGAFQISLQTKNASAREAVAIALKEMERIQKEPVSEKELESAKKYLIGSFPMRLDTQAKLVQFLLTAEFYGLGLDYPEKFPALIRAVSREDVMRVAKRYLDPGRPIIVIVGNLKEAGY